MVDAVLSYHLNGFTCGVARFNQQLAQRLGVPLRSIHSVSPTHPLISIKTAEIEPRPWFLVLPARTSFDLLLHDRPTTGADLIARADRVWYADEIGCPATIQGNPCRGRLHVLLFGMSHKLNGQAYCLERLRGLLDRAPVDYTVSVSTAVHEGSPWDGAFTTTCDTLRAVFADKLRVLGYLADDALARELCTCSAVALFFDPAARANNTTIWAALEASATVITNLDSGSPPDLRHNHTVFDIAQLEEWPDGQLRATVALGGKRAVAGRSWDTLLEVLCA